MLKGLNPLLGPDLLYSLRSMGHGEEIAIVDGNYPALGHGQRLVRMDGHGVIPVLNAVLSVLPLDWPAQESVFMPAVPKLHALAGKQQPVHDAIESAARSYVADIKCVYLQPDEFYPRVKSCHLIVATSEMALFGNVILRKGVVTA